VGRLSARGRADDDTSIICERLRIYARDTAPVIDHYARRGLITVLDGDLPQDAVFESIEAVVAQA
jgi:adenylate kinase